MSNVKEFKMNHNNNVGDELNYWPLVSFLKNLQTVISDQFLDVFSRRKAKQCIVRFQRKRFTTPISMSFLRNIIEVSACFESNLVFLLK